MDNSLLVCIGEISLGKWAIAATLTQRLLDLRV